jgi:ribosomal protein S18 acetylase RimI-like enzyme
VGYLAVLPDAQEGSMKLSKLYLLESHRGRGWGRKMVEFAEWLCAESGLERLWLTANRHNANSIAAYERMGFRNAGPIVTDIGGGYVMDDYRMEKKIQA